VLDSVLPREVGNKNYLKVRFKLPGGKGWKLNCCLG
jgi:hypothetical protein